MRQSGSGAVSELPAHSRALAMAGRITHWHITLFAPTMAEFPGDPVRGPSQKMASDCTFSGLPLRSKPYKIGRQALQFEGPLNKAGERRLKTHILRLNLLALICWLSISGFAAYANAQTNLSNQLSRPAGRTEGAGKIDEATAADAAATYSFSVLYNFCSDPNCTDGAQSFSGLIQDEAGNLYGTTFGGGANGEGAVFKLDSTGHITILYSFCSLSGCTDGTYPEAGLIADPEGNLYGTTEGGGDGSADTCKNQSIVGCGTVFKVDTTGHETVLYSFCSELGCADGSLPVAGLTRDAAGNLYGTTQNGGNGSTVCIGEGCGTVFKLEPNGHYSVLYKFCSVSGCTDGATPMAGLLLDAAGNLYGTTLGGGLPPKEPCENYDSQTDGCGTVFKIDSAGHYSVLYKFCSVSGCIDGDNPVAGLIEDDEGNLYGTASQGGDTGGAVFKLDSQGQETTLYRFIGEADGGNPVGGLVRDAAGNLYGTTQSGGATGSGTVFEVDNAGNETPIYNFCTQTGGYCPDGDEPDASLLEDAAGNLYGTTSLGGKSTYGSHGQGIVFKLASSLRPSTVALTPSALRITKAEALRVAVKVEGGKGNPTPTGTVTLTDGKYTSAPATLDAGAAAIIVPAGSLATGAGTLSAFYAGDSHYSAASSPGVVVTVTGDKVPVVKLASSAASILYGASVTLTATVTGSGAKPTGTVTFLEGVKVLGKSALNSGGVAVYSSKRLQAGKDLITASYSGNASYEWATSPAVSVTVKKAALTVTAKNLSKVYAAPLPTLPYALSGFVDGDTAATATSGKPKLTTTATESSPVGVYAVTPSVGTLAAANYTFKFVRGSLTIFNAPATATKAATSLTASGAVLNGSVKANDSTTKYWFAYGPSTASLTNTTAKTGALTGTTSTAVSATLTGLESKTTYYFQVLASNAGGTTRGSVLSFTTN
jgi:uncharacterized repeat protein (TIGR03803 family)